MNKDSAVGFIVSLVLHCIIAVGVFALLSSAPKPPSMPDMIAFSIDSIMDDAKQGDISDEPNIPPPSDQSEPDPEPEPTPPEPEPEPEPTPPEPEPIPEPEPHQKTT